MGTIREKLVLEDNFSQNFSRYIESAKEASEATDRARRNTENLSGASRQASISIGELAGSMATLFSAAALGRAAIELVELSDTMASINQRIDSINDGLQTSGELQEMIYASAMRSRGAYADTAQFVGKLGTLAGDAFASTEELVAFSEQINKLIRLSGSDAQAASAALLQLTQGLSSGMLRGEELNSVLEQTPMISKAIARQLGFSTGQLREFASEGRLTAEVVKTAILQASDETDEAFGELPARWSDLWTEGKNIALRAMEPVLDWINGMAANINMDDLLQAVQDNSDLIIGGLTGVAAAFAAAGAVGVATGLATAGAWLATYWPIAAVGAALSAVVIIGRSMGYEFSEIFGLIGWWAGGVAAFVGNQFVGLWRIVALFGNFVANFLQDPIAAASIFVIDWITLWIEGVRYVMGMLESLVNLIPGVDDVDLTSWLDRQVENNQEQKAIIYEDAGLKETFATPELLQFNEFSAKGSDIGSDVGAYLDELDITKFSQGIKDSLSFEDMKIDLSGIKADTGSIRGAVSSTEEDIKALVDVAERRYISQVNLTSQTPVIHVTGANTGDTAEDRRSLANAIRDILIEQASSGSVRAQGVF